MVRKRESDDEEEFEEEEQEEEEFDDEVRKPIKRPVIPSEKETLEKPLPPMQIVEREINLSLINDKLNYIISQIDKK